MLIPDLLALFCEVLCLVQEQICKAASDIIEWYKNKGGIAEALKLIYREYNRNNFLYDSDSTDYIILMNKLSEEQVKKIESSNEMCQRLFLQPACLKPEVPPDIIFSVIYSLIMNIKNKDILPFAHAVRI